MCLRKWFTPFIKQCFVTVGVTLNVMSHGLVMGYTVDLLMELKMNQDIPISEEIASWIASAPEMALVFSTLVVPVVIRKYGRRLTNLISAVIITAAWFGFVICSNIITLIMLRIFKGFAMGLNGFLGAIMIGEYTTPRLRGAFLTTVSLSIYFGIFFSQALGTILSWKQAAAVYGAIGLVDTVIIYLSPETPSFLAFQHKYDECRKVFRWLRGFDDEEELEKMIKARRLKEEVKDIDEKIKQRSLKVKISRIIHVVKKNEFYKPILLLISLFVWNQWAGSTAVYCYANVFYHGILGPNINFPLMIISTGLHAVVANGLSIILYRYVKRRKLLLMCTLLMEFTLIAIGLYVYGKKYDILPFDHPYIGVVLLHMLMIINAAVMTPLPNILMGEITPLRYREICGTISLLFCSANIVFIIKIAPFLISAIGLHGLFFLYASVVCVTFIQPWLQLPETKDRTLLEIEEEFREKPYIETDFKLSLSNNVDAQSSLTAIQ